MQRGSQRLLLHRLRCAADSRHHGSVLTRVGHVLCQRGEPAPLLWRPEVSAPRGTGSSLPSTGCATVLPFSLEALLSGRLRSPYAAVFASMRLVRRQPALPRPHAWLTLDTLS